MVAKIREEGLQRSRVKDFESYMTDVLGAPLTLSQDMKRARKGPAVIVDLLVKGDLEKYRGSLRARQSSLPRRQS